MGRTTRSSARLAANTAEKPAVVPEKKASPKKAAKKSKAAAPAAVKKDETKAPAAASKKKEEEEPKEEAEEEEKKEVKGDDKKQDIVSIEACKQWSAFKTRAAKIAKAVGSFAKVEITKEKPGKGNFVVRVNGGEPIIELKALTRPFPSLRALDMDEVSQQVLSALKG